MADVFCEEYSSSLKELTFNSKPHISMLTMLAEENSQYAPQIVKSIEAHLQKVKPEAKLPTLYLIDSIIKNVGQLYLGLFTQNLVSNFCSVFEKVDEKVRAQMYKLRQTWSDIFPNKKLYAIDVRVKELDPAWPILAQPPQQQTSIHINPKFLKSPAEDATMKTLQDLDGDVVRQKLLAKQQEMVRLQREKLELELLQTQAVVEEQKRQLLMQEQKLRNQQQQVDLQKKLTLHQLTNMGAALAVVANQSLQLDPAKLKQLKVDTQPDAKDNASKDQNQPVTTATTPAAAAAAVINTKPSVNFSQTVISPLMSVSNKTNDANPLIMQGSDKSVANKNQPQLLSNSFQAPSHLVTNMSHLKSVIQQPIVGKSSLETAVHKNIGSVAPVLEGKSEGVGLKTSPKMRSDKNEKDKNSSSKSKSPGNKKRSISSASKSKEEEASKSKAGDGSKASNSSKDNSSSFKVKARSKSNSLSPSKSRGTGKSKQWSPTTSSSRRSSNHSRSRSPNRREKNRDRDDRSSKRERRSPRRDKENDTGSSRSKTLGSTKELNKQDDEPPYKKSKTGDPELDEIFSGKDQDYRQLDHPVPKLSPLHSTEYQGWAQYKASRPEQFKSQRSRDSTDHRESFGFGKQDLDLRTNSALPVRGKLPAPWLPYRIPKLNQAKDGRPFERAGGPAVHPRMDPRLLAQGTNNYYQATRESDPSIPRALMFDRGPEIMRQADSQLRSGQLTVEQHREIMEQLAKLYELQRMRHMQREQHMRESIMSQRSDIGQHQDVIASSPEGSPRSESEISKPESSKPTTTSATTDAAVAVVEVPEPVKEKVDENEVPEVAVKVEPKSTEDEVIKAKPEATEEEVSIVLEAKRDPPKEKTTIEVVISDDDDDDDKKRKSKSGRSRDSAVEAPVPRHPPRGASKNMPVNTVMIDDQPREVRFFGNVAIVLLENNDPREIAFRGPPQEVLIGKQIVRLGFNNEVKEFEFENEKHNIRFGAPTRELLIDDVPYCAVFGGPPITVTLNGKTCELRLCGPTPEVFFGDKPRHDILPQIMEMETEDRRNFQPQHQQQQQPQQAPFKPVIVDKPLSPGGRWGPNPNRDYDSRDWRPSNREEQFQRGPRDSGNRDDWQPSMPQQSRGSMRFNDEPFRPERSGPFRDESRGPPMPPRGPDVWSRWDDQRGNYRGPMPPMRGDMMPEPGGRHGNSNMNDYYDDDRNGPRPQPGGFYMDSRYNHGGPGPIPPPMRRHPIGGSMPSRFDEPGMPMRPMAPHGMGGPPHPMGPIPPGGMKYRPQFVNYPRPNPHDRYGGPPHPDYPYAQNQHMPVGFNPPAPVPPQPINVNELFEKLVSTGIIPQMASAPNTESNKPEEETEKIKVVDEKVPLIELTTDSLKIKRPVIFTILYTGIQCSSCGVRFTSEQTDKYAQHLDWHFRQNRREKDSARKALSRKWYYDVQDWVQFEEIEDLEERARSFFEIQNSDEQGEDGEDNGPSVPAGEKEEDKKCAVCQELFELYWDEEHEEWHFRDALRRDDKNYHPLCYEDFKEQSFREEATSLKDERMEEEIHPNPEETETAVKAEPSGSEEVAPEEPKIKEEPVAMETNNDLDVPANEPPPTAVVEEPMETDEPESTEDVETKPEGGFLGVFNVLSTSYKIPPLLMWESEEPSENQSTEKQSESEPVAVKEEPVVEGSDDSVVPSVSESGNVENGDEMTACDSGINQEEDSENDDEPTDLNAVEENVELDTAVANVSLPEEQDENELMSLLTEETPQVSVSLELKQPEEQDESMLGVVEEVNEEKAVTDEAATEQTISVLDNQSLEEKANENISINPISNVNISSDENVVKESESVFIAPAHTVASTTGGDDDVVLKESSDVVSDFSFETSGVGTLEDGGLQSDMVSSDPSLVDKEDEDSDEDVNTSEERLESEVEFVVQPPVSRGTEVSGLCSIM